MKNIKLISNKYVLKEFGIFDDFDNCKNSTNVFATGHQVVSTDTFKKNEYEDWKISWICLFYLSVM